jgi:S-formylglutathione hydrolase FrmB
METQLFVIAPQEGKYYDPGNKAPGILILLHGLSDNASSWVRYTALERYAEQENWLVAMPEVQRSFYTNMKFGLAYEDYIALELPEIIAKIFYVSKVPEDHILAGFSMGGYGALRCGLRHADRFRLCGSFSGVIDPQAAVALIGDEQMRLCGDLAHDLDAVLGSDRNVNDAMDIETLLDHAVKKGKVPELFLTCGTDDFLFEQNQKFAAGVEKRGSVTCTYDTWPGAHEWNFWDASIVKLFSHLKS